MKEYILIRIKRETAEILKDLGTKRDSYDDVIRRLINDRGYSKRPDRR